MKITVYTIKDCAFSKQEKEYLNTNKLVFEEKDLETNKDFLTEMLAISNNFAGTPVTRVEKDDGSIAVLKGFTKEEFDTTFGFAVAPTNQVTSPAPVNDTPIPTPPVVEAPPTESVPPLAPVPAPVETPVETPVEVPVEAPASPTPIVDPLKSVMDDLQAKSVDRPTTTTADTAVPTPPDGAPTIPDFPAK